MKLLRPETRENIRENVEEGLENETRNFYTPTRSVRISSTQNDPDISRNSMSMVNLGTHAQLQTLHRVNSIKGSWLFKVHRSCVSNVCLRIQISVQDAFLKSHF